MKKINIIVACVAAVAFSACNKKLEEFAPIPVAPYPTGTTIAATLTASANDSLFNRMLIRSGLQSLFADNTKQLTLFAVDSNGMKAFVNAASGGAIPANAPSSIVSAFLANTLPAGTAAGIIQYNTLGQKVLAANIGTAFPNFPYTSQIVLDPNQPFVRSSIFPVRGTTFSYVNNLPITAVDIQASNGVIHRTASVVTPPTTLLKGAIAGQATLKYFREAVARADSGAVGTSRIDSLLNFGVTNMTVLAPNDAAFQGLLTPLITGALIAQGVAPATAAAQATALVNAVDANGNPTVFRNPLLFAAIPASTVRGIVAYHVLASGTTSIVPNIRVFSVNVPGAPAFVKTLVNGSVAAHPGVNAVAAYTAGNPFPTSVQFRGLGTLPSGGTPYSGPAANVVLADRHSVNGVFHIIDRVLLPQ
jgi:hypothetical protein